VCFHVQVKSSCTTIESCVCRRQWEGWGWQDLDKCHEKLRCSLSATSSGVAGVGGSERWGWYSPLHADNYTSDPSQPNSEALFTSPTLDSRQKHPASTDFDLHASSSLPLLLRAGTQAVDARTLPPVSELCEDKQDISEEKSIQEPLWVDSASPDRGVTSEEKGVANCSSSHSPQVPQLPARIEEHLKTGWANSGVWRLGKILSESLLTKEKPHKSWAFLCSSLSCPSMANDTPTKSRYVHQALEDRASSIESECSLVDETPASPTVPMLEFDTVCSSAAVKVCCSQSVRCLDSPCQGHIFAHSLSCPSMRKTLDCPWLVQHRYNLEFLHVRKVRFSSSVAIQSIPVITPSDSDVSTRAVSTLTTTASYLNLRTMEEVQLRDTILYGQYSKEVSDRIILIVCVRDKVLELF